jgi:hypothetical protein
MDRYALTSIFFIVGLIIWHAILGILVFENPAKTHQTSGGWIVRVDRFVCCGILGFYLVIQAIFLIWLFCVPLKYRRVMKQKDSLYDQLTSKKWRRMKDKLKKQF